MSTPIVIDNGSGNCKAGFVGQVAPSLILRNCIGRPRLKLEQFRLPYIGNEALAKRGILSIVRPVRFGIITNFQEMENIWSHVFKELHVTAREHPLILTEPPHNPIENKTKTAEIMFEKFEVPSIYFGMSAVMALYGIGRTTGTILDSGEGLTYTISVFDGEPLPLTFNQMYLAGFDVTDYLLKLLITSEKHLFLSKAERETIRNVKEQFCYVAQDYSKQLEIAAKDKTFERSHVISDDYVITLNTERFQSPEILFQPHMVGNDTPGIHEIIYDSILKADINLRKELLANIVLCGGNTLIPGIAERIRKEISILSQNSETDVTIVEDSNRMNLAWSGCSAFASSPKFADVLIAKKEYEENGSNVFIS